MDKNELRKQTVMARYGVDNVAKLAKVQDKRRSTFASHRPMIYYEQPQYDHTINADDCMVYKLNKDVADQWLDTNYILKAPRGNVLSLGLVKDDVIYAIMTFKKPKNPEYLVELSRLAMLPGYNVINGYDKLSKYASDFGLYNIVAYVRTSFDDVKYYEDMGMKYVRSIQPTKWWTRNNEFMSDASRRQYEYTQEMLLYDGWFPVYDCGQKVYVFE